MDAKPVSVHAGRIVMWIRVNSPSPVMAVRIITKRSSLVMIIMTGGGHCQFRRTVSERSSVRAKDDECCRPLPSESIAGCRSLVLGLCRSPRELPQS